MSEKKWNNEAIWHVKMTTAKTNCRCQNRRWEKHCENSRIINQQEPTSKTRTISPKLFKWQHNHSNNDLGRLSFQMDTPTFTKKPWEHNIENTTEHQQNIWFTQTSWISAGKTPRKQKTLRKTPMPPTHGFPHFPLLQNVNFNFSV